jgi:ubiquinone/menaquinone biosynthesis C-methylase UbiE
MLRKLLIPLFVSQFRKPQGFLGRIVGHYMARRHQERNQWTIKLLNIQPSDRILEIGFRPGWTIEQIAKIETVEFMAGIDHSEVMVKQASQRNAEAIKQGKVKLLLGSVDSLPYQEDFFDKIFAVNVHMMWEEPIKTLKKLQQVLKPGGLIAITLQPVWANNEAEVQASQDKIVDLLTEAGFKQLQQYSLSLKPVNCISVLDIKEPA